MLSRMRGRWSEQCGARCSEAGVQGCSAGISQPLTTRETSMGEAGFRQTRCCLQWPVAQSEMESERS